MDKIEIEGFKLVGLALTTKTTNESGQSAIDCGNLWQKFETESLAGKIPGKISDEIYAVYYNYEGDYTKPFSYFIGCKVKADAQVAPGMDSLEIAGGSYQKFVAEGIMPDCVANSWKEIWTTDIPRAYRADFEIYDERSKDWKDAEVEIFISVK